MRIDVNEDLKSLSYVRTLWFSRFGYKDSTPTAEIFAGCAEFMCDKRKYFALGIMTKPEYWAVDIKPPQLAYSMCAIPMVFSGWPDVEELKKALPTLTIDCSKYLEYYVVSDWNDYVVGAPMTGSNPYRRQVYDFARNAELLALAHSTDE